MELEKIIIEGLENIYSVSVFKKEFRKTVEENWKEERPFRRYQNKLIANLSVLDQEKERAIELNQF